MREEELEEEEEEEEAEEAEEALSAATTKQRVRYSMKCVMDQTSETRIVTTSVEHQYVLPIVLTWNACLCQHRAGTAKSIQGKNVTA